MKRITRYLLPVIILVAAILLIAVLGLLGEVFTTIASAVMGFFFKHWDYALIILVTSVVTSLICAWLEDHRSTKPNFNGKKNIKKRTNSTIDTDD